MSHVVTFEPIQIIPFTASFCAQFHSVLLKIMKGAFKSRTPQIEYTLGGWRVTGKVDGLHAGYIAAAQAKVGKVHWWYAWRACLHITNRVSTQRNTVLHVGWRDHNVGFRIFKWIFSQMRIKSIFGPCERNCTRQTLSFHKTLFQDDNMHRSSPCVKLYFSEWVQDDNIYCVI